MMNKINILFFIGFFAATALFSFGSLNAKEKKEKKQSEEKKEAAQKRENNKLETLPWYYKMNSDSVKGERPQTLPKKHKDKNS
jgi:hypothetical protein